MNFLKKIAPFLGAALSLGGPLGAMAGNALNDALGAKPGAKVDDVLASLTKTALTPEQLAAVQSAENDFQIQMKKLDIQSAEDFEKMSDDDRANARNREIQVKDWTPRILAFLVVILCFAGEGIYFFTGAPRNASPELTGRILGTLDSALILVLGYYFGSSAGSDRKTELMGQTQLPK